MTAQDDAWNSSDNFSFADEPVPTPSTQSAAPLAAANLVPAQPVDAWGIDASFVDEIGAVETGVVGQKENGVLRTENVQALIDELSQMTTDEVDHTVNMTKEEAVVSFAATVALLRYDFNRIYGEHFKGDYDFATACQKFADVVKERRGDIGFEPLADGGTRAMVGQARELLDHLVRVAQRLHMLQVPERETARLCQIVQDRGVFTPQYAVDLKTAFASDEYAPKAVQAFKVADGGKINLDTIFKLYSKTAEEDMRRETELSQVIAAKLQSQGQR